ncbi:hypothetical protein ACFVWN_01285 [Nocardiopsis flavescens]|uniref:hypothetical protein n=1 Tax=Nocardiopsis flavescens TaxID=758803 RepID=UPI0036627967
MPDAVHVMPVGDLVEHDNSGEADCLCGPATEPVHRPDGSVGWVIVHHSLDGREQREEASMSTTRPPSPAFRVFGRDPVLWLGLLRAALYVISVFVLTVPEHVSAAIIAFAAAGFGLADAAIVVRDKLVPAIMGFAEAGLALVLAFGVDLSADQLAAVMFLVATVTSFVTRTQVTAPVDAEGNRVTRYTLGA